MNQFYDEGRRSYRPKRCGKSNKDEDNSPKALNDKDLINFVTFDNNNNNNNNDICKKLKFDHTNKWYMHNPAAVLGKDTHKLLWDFDIQTDHLISARKPDLIVINKKKKKKKKKKEKRTCKIVDFAVPANHRIKVKESEKKDKYLDLVWE